MSEKQKWNEEAALNNNMDSSTMEANLEGVGELAEKTRHKQMKKMDKANNPTQSPGS